MPFVSKAQQGYICATDKKLCKHFAQSTPKSAYKSLPYYVGDKKKSKGK
jgi:hypothetical protein